MDELPTDTIIHIYDLIGKPLIFDITRYIIEYAMDRRVIANNGIVNDISNRFGGKLFGLRLTYDNSNNTKLTIRSYFLNGKRHGLTQYWSSGRDGHLMYEENYLYGKMHGKQVDYYWSGQIKRIAHWNNGKLHGGSITYDVNNEITSNIIYDNNKIISINSETPKITTVVIGEKSIITKYVKRKIVCTIEMQNGKRH
jgi:antitoxin component YwqK of YwqJK toxin-antitoxin module